MTKKIVAIWAQDEEGVIGKGNRLPWHLPAELQHFKETTLNHAILMGRVTFDGMGRRLLPKRETLILTRNPEEKIDGGCFFSRYPVCPRLVSGSRQESLYYRWAANFSGF